MNKLHWLDNYWNYRHGDSLSGHRGFVDECPYSLPESELKAIEKRKNERLSGLNKRNKFW